MSRPAPELRAEKVAVPSEFDRVAPRYDLLAALNPGYARHLRSSVARMRLPDRSRVLDLCCGTGLSTKAIRAVLPGARITGMDASVGMLEAAREKRELSDVTWLVGDATDPAAHGAAGPYDGVLMAYGLRNVPDPELCLRNLLPLLAPGGTLCLHEYSVAGSRWARMVWNLVIVGVVIPLAVLLTGSSRIFRYLRRSVLEFDSVPQLEERLRRAGFVNVRTETMDGWQRGIVHSFLAERP
jgi:ubiquinone/menaquinone biosynthesis C-methylase UbiE